MVTETLPEPWLAIEAVPDERDIEPRPTRMLVFFLCAQAAAKIIKDTNAIVLNETLFIVTSLIKQQFTFYAASTRVSFCFENAQRAD